MRINMYQNGGTGAQDLTNAEGVATGPITITNDPTAPLGAVAKQYVDNAVLNLSASNITSGTLSAAFLPAYSGDASSVAGSAVFTLTPTGISPGRYTKLTVDAKGRGISGSNIIEADIPNLDWTDIVLDKPNSIDGYGITDAVRLTGGTLTANLILSGAPATANHAATRGYLDSLVTANAGGQAAVGTISLRLNSRPSAGYLRCNGATISKTTYAALYAVLGDEFVTPLQPGSGKPWEQQYEVNLIQADNLAGWTAGANLPAIIFDAHVLVTRNRVYLLGGEVNGVNSSAVYTSEISSDGSLGSWSLSTALPVTLRASQVIVTKNRVHLIGGSSASVTNAVYTAPVNSDGTLGTWSTGGSLPAPVMQAKAVVTKTQVFLIGGANSLGELATVYVATINSDGTLAAWASTTALPAAVREAGLAVTKNRIYLFGGLTTGSTYLSTVYTAVINSNGTLGAWSTSTALPLAIAPAGVYVSRNKVYILGGSVTGGSQTKVVYVASINTDGTLGTWSASAESISGNSISESSMFVTSSSLFLVGPNNDVRYVAISDGMNDYSRYYDGTAVPTPTTDFVLPNLESSIAAGTGYFIKT